MMDEETTPSIGLPLFCPEGHQVYIVHFPQLKKFGFACGVCHILADALTHGAKVLEIHPVTDPQGFKQDRKADLLIGVGTKAAHVKCGKGHNLMAFQFTEGFGVGCIHCKVYCLTFEDKGVTLEIREVRELAKGDGLIKPLASPKVPDTSPFTIN